jgi:hypothetical protein
VRLLVDRFALLSGLHDVEQIGGTRQAADMGGENSVGAFFHCCSRLLVPSFRVDAFSSALSG